MRQTAFQHTSEWHGSAPQRLNLTCAAAFLSLYCLTAWAPGLLSIGDVAVGNLFLPFSVLFLLTGPVEMPKLGPVTRLLVLWMTAMVAVLLILSLLSLTHVPDQYRTGRAILSYAMFVPIMMCTLAVAGSGRGQLFETALVRGGVICCAIVLLLLIIPGLRSHVVWEGDRVSGFFKNPNQFGIVLATLIPVAIARALAPENRSMVGWGGVLIMVLALIASGSKTNIAVVGCVAATQVLLAPWLTPNKFKAALGFCVTLVLLLGLAVPVWHVAGMINPRLIDLIAGFVSGIEEPATLIGRAELWRAGMAEGLAAPWTGEGAGQPALQPLTGERFSHSHNVLIDHFRTMGLPGLIALCGIMLSVTGLAGCGLLLSLRSHATRGARLSVMGSALGCLSFLLGNQMSDSFGPSTMPVFWVVLCSLVFRVADLERSRWIPDPSRGVIAK